MTKCSMKFTMISERCIGTLVCFSKTNYRFDSKPLPGKILEPEVHCGAGTLLPRLSSTHQYLEQILIYFDTTKADLTFMNLRVSFV